MGEAEFRDDLLEVRIHRILVEFGLAQVDHERRGGKFDLVGGQLDVVGNQSLAVQANREFLSYGPLVLGPELELVIGNPFPVSIQLGRDGDALLRGSADRFERRRRRRKLQPQGPWRALVSDGSQRRRKYVHEYQ